jgi:hypothetical protein
MPHTGVFSQLQGLCALLWFGNRESQIRRETGYRLSDADSALAGKITAAL